MLLDGGVDSASSRGGARGSSRYHRNRARASLERVRLCGERAASGPDLDPDPDTGREPAVCSQGHRRRPAVRSSALDPAADGRRGVAGAPQKRHYLHLLGTQGFDRSERDACSPRSWRLGYGDAHSPREWVLERADLPEPADRQGDAFPGQFLQPVAEVFRHEIRPGGAEG